MTFSNSRGLRSATRKCPPGSHAATLGVRELARRVGRDVRSVHADAGRLASIGLIHKTADGKPASADFGDLSQFRARSTSRSISAAKAKSRSMRATRSDSAGSRCTAPKSRATPQNAQFVCSDRSTATRGAYQPIRELTWG
jgi:hypothetical protein